MNKKKLLLLVDFLINSYKAALTNSNIVKSLIDSSSFRFLGKAIEEDVLVKNLSLSKAIENSRLLPSSFVNILNAAENSGRFVEVLQSYAKILKDSLKIEEDLKTQKLYFSFILFVFMLGSVIFYYLLNNIVMSIIENKDTAIFGFVKTVSYFLNPYTVFVFVLLCLTVIILLSFRNTFLDFFEYYVLGRSYRNIVFSQVMDVWGTLINSGIPISKSLGIATLTVDNNYFKDLLFSYFHKVTNGFTKFDHQVADKIFDVFPQDYRLILKNSFEAGNLDENLLDISGKLYEEALNSLRRKIKIIFSLTIVSTMIIIGIMIIAMFLALYSPVFDEIN